MKASVIAEYNDLLAIKLAALSVVKHLDLHHVDSPEIQLLKIALDYEKVRRESTQAHDKS